MHTEVFKGICATYASLDPGAGLGKVDWIKGCSVLRYFKVCRVASCFPVVVKVEQTNKGTKFA